MTHRVHGPTGSRPGAAIWGLLALAAAAPAAGAATATSGHPARPSAATAGGGFSTQVRFANNTAHRRIEWGQATVPFPQGAFFPGDNFGVAGLPSELIPFGASWPDGSIRFAQLAVPLDLAPGAETLVDVTQLAPTPYSFQYSSWVQAGLPAFKVKVVVVLPGGKLSVVEPALVRMEHDTDIRKTHYFRGRVPQTDLVCDLWYTIFSGQDHMPFELRLTASSTASPLFSQAIESAHLWVEGAAAHVRAARRRGAGYGVLSAKGPNVVHLLGPSTLWDGQGQEWCGDFLFYYPNGTANGGRSDTLMSTIRSSFFGVSTDWGNSGAYGPFGHVPLPPPWIKDGGRAAAIAARQSFEQWLEQDGSPWDNWPLGLNKFPGQTGYQPDFGSTQVADIFASGMPDRIEEARLNASEEALRPVHHREADGTMVRAANHPTWVTWDGRTHYHPQVSPDRLGKPTPEPQLKANGWVGRDVQHWSTLILSNAYLLTMSPSLRYELDNDAELYIAGHTLPSARKTATNAPGAARGVGRTLLCMAWNYLLTANDGLKYHVAERVRQSIVPAAIGLQVSGPVKPLVLTPPDPRQLMRDHWRPWEESQAAMGLEAASRVMQVQEAHDLAKMLAYTLIQYGWKVLPNDTVIGTGLGWKSNGAPLTTAEMNDPTWALWSYGTGFNEWAIPSVKLAIRYGKMYGDSAIVNRAMTVLQTVWNQRQAPSNGGWDAYTDWDAVR